MVLFRKTSLALQRQIVEGLIYVLVPVTILTENLGLPTLMEGTHRNAPPDKPYNPVLLPGQALMFDARLETSPSIYGGGVALAILFDTRIK